MGFNSPARVMLKLASLFLIASAFATCSAALAQSGTRGDVNADGAVDAADLTLLTDYLFLGGPPPLPLESGDIDECMGPDVSDAVLLGRNVYGDVALPNPDTMNCAFSPDQDPGARDTCRYEPASSTWEISDASDDLFSIALYGWTDSPDIMGASLAFKVRTSTGDGFDHDDSLIVVDTFVFSPDVATVPIKIYSRSLLDESIDTSANNVGFNGYILGLIGLFFPVLPQYTPVHIGDLTLRILDPADLPSEFEITLDSNFFPPAGVFKYSPMSGEGYPPEFVSGTIHVINQMAAPEEPTIGLDPPSLFFSATEEGPNPPSQILNISNTGEGTLNWDAWNSSPWLTLSQYSGTGDAAVTLSVDITGLTQSTYFDTIVVSDTSATNDPQIVPIYLFVEEGTPVLMLEPGSFAFSVVEGGWGPDPDTLLIWNAGGGTLNWETYNSSSWLVTDPSSGIGDGQTSLLVSIAGLSAGEYGDTIVVSDSLASNSPQYVPVYLTVWPALDCEITADPGDEVCNGSVAEFCAPLNMVSYSWSGPGLADTNQQCVTVGDGLAPGVYTYTVTITDSLGNQSTCSRELTVLENPICEITGDDAVCEGSSTIWCASEAPPDMFYTYEWVGPGGFVSPERCVTVGEGLPPGVYVYELVITDQYGCESDCSRELTVLENPICEITGDDTVCEGSTTIWCASETPPGMSYTYEWVGPGGFVSLERCVTVGEGLPPGVHVYQLVITDQYGCESVCDRDLTVLESPICEINAAPGNIIIEGESAELCATEGMIEYYWVGPGIDATYVQCVTVGEGLAPGEYTYTVTITDLSGCQSSCSLDLIVLESEPVMQLEPYYFFFTMEEGGPNPPGQELSIANIGSGVLEWQIGETESWLFLSDTAGIAPSMVMIEVDGTSLAPGFYSDTVMVYGNAINSPQYVLVDLEVVPVEPVMQLEPYYFFFTMEEGGPNPPDQELSIANIGSGVLEWQIGETESWLFLSDTAGIAPSMVMIEVDGTSLAPGFYSDTVMVYGNAINSPQFVLVDLEVESGAGCGGATALIDPDTVYAYQAFAIDPIYYSVYLGDFDLCEVPLIDLATVQLIGDGVPVVPTDVAVLDSFPGFEDEVLAVTFAAADFFDAYGLLWAWSVQSYTVEGVVLDSTPFSVSSQVTVRGHRLGDANCNGNVDIDDVVFMAYFVFSAGPAPSVEEAVDLDASGSVDIDDIVHLVSYIFAGREIPCDKDGDGIPDF